MLLPQYHYLPNNCKKYFPLFSLSFIVKYAKIVVTISPGRRTIMEKVLNKILGKLDSLVQGQQELRQDYQALVQGQRELRQDYQALEQGQRELRQGYHSLEQGQQELKASVQKIESKIDKLELCMEEEVFNKIGAMFNGYGLRGDQIERLQQHLDERLDSIETDTRYLVARVARLEKLAK
jgi:chromosome segregation ATPase